MILTTVYRATGSDYYVIFIRKSDGFIFDNDASELAVAPSWADSALALVEVSGKGQYPVVTPEGLPAGNYDAVVYSGSSPANTDNKVIGFDVKVGSIFGF